MWILRPAGPSGGVREGRDWLSEALIEHPKRRKSLLYVGDFDSFDICQTINIPIALANGSISTSVQFKPNSVRQMFLTFETRCCNT